MLAKPMTLPCRDSTLPSISSMGPLPECRWQSRPGCRGRRAHGPRRRVHGSAYIVIVRIRSRRRFGCASCAPEARGIQTGRRRSARNMEPAAFILKKCWELSTLDSRLDRVSSFNCPITSATMKHVLTHTSEKSQIRIHTINTTFAYIRIHSWTSTNTRNLATAFLSAAY